MCVVVRDKLIDGGENVVGPNVEFIVTITENLEVLDSVFMSGREERH